MFSFNGSLLRLSALKSPPYSDLEYENGTYVLKDSIHQRIVDILAKKYNFVYEVQNAEQIWGNFENGIWKGCIGHLYNKSSDIAICDLTVTYDRQNVVDFTRVLDMSPIGLVTRAPDLKSRAWITFDPFSTPVWLCLLTSLAMTAISFKLLYMKTISLCQIWTWLIAAMFQQGIIKNLSNKSPIRWYLGIWLLLSMIVMKSYSGVFYSFITVPKFEDTIETIDDLVSAAESGEYYIIQLFVSIYRPLFTKAKCCGDYYKIGRAINETDIPLPTTVSRALDLFEEYKERKLILMEGMVEIMYSMGSLDQNLYHISSSVIFVDYISMAVQKGSPFLHILDNAFVEMGLYNHWKRQIISRTPLNVTTDHIYKNLSFKDFFSVYIICFCLLIASIVILLFEIQIRFRMS